ncbi:DUF4240 domain-containing protein [Paractinoplanes toevensis]|uniref:DUF4240 domain-containing protein n=1 Tax=Paractinoplanes toevensis TaxID=571911 RepID=UPI001FE9FC65|nr:DUF4240 domain-containing protein [Actinoplanes toevensis]
MNLISEEPGRVPTAAEEDRFWLLVEEAWARLGPEPAALRRELLTRDLDEEDEEPYAVEEWLDPFLDCLRTASGELSRQDLVDLDRVLERKLYEIDREDIQQVTDGSDDGFLYCRGFIVALGHEYYTAVKRDPRFAVLDAECENMCYFFGHLHQERFGEWPQTGSGISRESNSNVAGWAS